MLHALIPAALILPGLPVMAQAALPAAPAPGAPASGAPASAVPANPAPAPSAPGDTSTAAPGTQVPAQPPGIPQPPGPAADVWMPASTVELRVMNKVDSHPQTVTLKVGENASFGSLTITARSCLARPADQVQDWAAYLDITDSHQDEPSFHGWMLAREPWIGMLEHPVYDVRLVSCS